MLAKCDCGAGTGQVHRETCAIVQGLPKGHQYQTWPNEPPPEQVRGVTHGDYTIMATTIGAIKAVVRGSPNWGQLSFVQQESLDLIATKIGRIVCGDPNHRDHWQDIVGYATLVLDRIGHKKG